jgi:hypothetical protein
VGYFVRALWLRYFPEPDFLHGEPPEKGAKAAELHVDGGVTETQVRGFFFIFFYIFFLYIFLIFRFHVFFHLFFLLSTSFIFFFLFIFLSLHPLFRVCWFNLKAKFCMKSQQRITSLARLTILETLRQGLMMVVRNKQFGYVALCSPHVTYLSCRLLAIDLFCSNLNCRRKLDFFLSQLIQKFPTQNI